MFVPFYINMPETVGKTTNDLASAAKAQTWGRATEAASYVTEKGAAYFKKGAAAEAEAPGVAVVEAAGAATSFGTRIANGAGSAWRGVKSTGRYAMKPVNIVRGGISKAASTTGGVMKDGVLKVKQYTYDKVPGLHSHVVRPTYNFWKNKVPGPAKASIEAGMLPIVQRNGAQLED
jgi:hypothetical protein